MEMASPTSHYMSQELEAPRARACMYGWLKTLDLGEGVGIQGGITYGQFPGKPLDKTLVYNTHGQAIRFRVG